MFNIQDKRVLIVSPEAWGDMRLSKHHYATTMAQMGAAVFFLDPCGTMAGKIEVHGPTGEGVTIVTPPGPVPGTRFLPRWLRAHMDTKLLERVAIACGGPFDILWNFDLYRFRSLESRKNATTRILHVMDLPMPKVAEEPARNADLVVAVSPSMLRGLEHISSRTLHVPHGIMLPEVWSKPSCRLPNGPHLGYLGNLNIRYLDTGGLLRIAKEHPDVSLHLYGPWQGAFGNPAPLAASILGEFQKLPNVVLHGPIPSSSIFEELSRMDLLLIAYDTKRYPTQIINSHKVLEYLLTGRAVLASHMSDLTDLDDLIAMAPPGVGIADEIDRVLCQLDELNSPERAARRRAHARTMTYGHHVRTILDRLDQLPPHAG